MVVGGVIGSVTELWRFPVKSMGGEQCDHVHITEKGVLGDRAYALIDTDMGRVVSAKSVKRFPQILNCKTTFVEPPPRSGALPPVQILLPTGDVVRSDSADADRSLSKYFNRNVVLKQSAPEDFTVDQYHPDVEGADPGGSRDTVVAQKLGSALFASLGMVSPVPVGSFLDVFPISILTTSTLDRLSQLQPHSCFDLRRFRMNVILKTQTAGFIENDWVGRTLAVGQTTRLNVALPDPRCVMVTVGQDELPKDTDVLKTLVRHNRLQLGDMGAFPCAGVYAVVSAPDGLRTGDKVLLN